MKIDMDIVHQRALAEINEERMRLAIEAEKERMRRKKSLWQRLTEWLPFIITRRKK